MADPNDIDAFINQFAGGRSQRASVSQGWDVDDEDQYDGQYDAQPTQECYPVPMRQNPGQYGISYPSTSSIQRDETMSDYYTYTQPSTVPSYAYTNRTSVVPPRQHPFDQQLLYNQPTPTNQATYLPCEFVNINGCNERFHPEEPELWIDHISSHHLQNHFPKKVICWFCDESVFNYRDFQRDRCVAFHARMWHIREHIVEERKNEHDIRPDYDLARHLMDHRLISEKQYHRYMSYNEPMPPKLQYSMIPSSSRSRKGGGAQGHKTTTSMNPKAGDQPSPKGKAKELGPTESSGTQSSQWPNTGHHEKFPFYDVHGHKGKDYRVYVPASKRTELEGVAHDEKSDGHSPVPNLLTSVPRETGSKSLTSMPGLAESSKDTQAAALNIAAMKMIDEANAGVTKGAGSEEHDAVLHQDTVGGDRTVNPEEQEADVATRFAKTMAGGVSPESNHSLANEISGQHANSRIELLIEQFLAVAQVEDSDPSQVRGRKIMHKLRRDIARQFQHNILGRRPFEDTQESIRLAGESSQMNVDDKPSELSPDLRPSQGLAVMGETWSADSIENSAYDPEGRSGSLYLSPRKETSQEDDTLAGPWGGLVDAEAVVSHFSRQECFGHLVKAAGGLMEQYHSPKMDLIRQKILLSPRSMRGSEIQANNQQAVFYVDWDIRGFLQSNYDDGLQQRIGSILAVIGDLETGKICTVDDYMATAWPSSQNELIEALEHAVQGKGSGRRGQSNIHIHVHEHLPLTTQVPVETDDRVDVASDLQKLTVTGSEEFIVMVGQQLAWLTAVCHDKKDTPMYAYVGFERESEHVKDREKPSSLGHQTRVKQPPCSGFLIQVHLERPPQGTKRSCWNKLVGPAVLITGFPLSDRDQKYKGLDISVPIMSLLAGIPDAITFRGKYIFKGWHHALVPTACHDGETIQWHLLESPQERLTWENINKNLSEDTPEFHDEETFWKSRAFLGWCPEVHDYFGSAEYNYKRVRPSDAKSPGSRPQVEKMTFGFTQWVQLTAEISVGKKEGYIAPSFGYSYLDVLEDAKKKAVILYDTASSRAFQTNGEDLILHVIMHRRYLGLYSSSCTQQHQVNSGRIKPAQLNRETSSTRQTMLDNAEEVLSVHPRKSGPGMEERLFKEEVDRLYTKLDGLWASSYVPVGKAMPLKFSSDLGGWEYLELVKNSYMRPESVRTQQSCGKWIEYARDLQAITLFGSFFGDLLVPADPTAVCSLFTSLPKDKSYLAVRTDTLRSLVDSHSPPGRNWLTRSGFVLEQPQPSSPTCKHPEDDSTCSVEMVLRLTKGARKSVPKPQTPAFLYHHHGAVILGEPRIGALERFRGIFSPTSSPCQPKNTWQNNPYEDSNINNNSNNNDETISNLNRSSNQISTTSALSVHLSPSTRNPLLASSSQAGGPSSAKTPSYLVPKSWASTLSDATPAKSVSHTTNSSAGEAGEEHSARKEKGKERGISVL